MGVAISDPLGIIAVGLPTISFRGLTDALLQLQRIVDEHDIEAIVVGFPFSLRGDMNRAGHATTKFIEALRQRFSMPVIHVDERFTSVMANDTIKQLGRSPSKSREKKDELAARFILQSYLDSRKQSNPA